MIKRHKHQKNHSRAIRPLSTIHVPRTNRVATSPEPASSDDGPSGEDLAEMAAAPEVEAVVEVPETKKERSTRSQDNAYTLYLREIGQTKLLTPQEEVVLANRIQ